MHTHTTTYARTYIHTYIEKGEERGEEKIERDREGEKATHTQSVGKEVTSQRPRDARAWFRALVISLPLAVRALSIPSTTTAADRAFSLSLPLSLSLFLSLSSFFHSAELTNVLPSPKVARSRLWPLLSPELFSLFNPPEKRERESAHTHIRASEVDSGAGFSLSYTPRLLLTNFLPRYFLPLFSHVPLSLSLSSVSLLLSGRSRRKPREDLSRVRINVVG